ncbi:MAG: hypothetical protein J1E62_05905 [Lachnospiraceae bacterium]|nr:hypothetical protein [Lachnospiraceae bacterium]
MMGKILKVAWVEYIGFMTSKRVLFMLFAFIFLAEDVVGKMGSIAAEYGYKIGRLEPIILIFSYQIHAMIIPIMFVVMLSNFPSNEKSGYFTMCRINRLSWLFGEVIYAGMVGFTFILFLFAGTAAWIWKDSAFMTEWSPYMSKLYMEFPEVYEWNDRLFIKTETLAQGKPVGVMLHSVGLMMLYLLVLTLLLALFKLLSLKRVGIFLTVSITLIGVALDNFNSVAKWIFPIVQGIYESHFIAYLARTEFPLAYSYIYFGVLIVVLCLINAKLVKRYVITEESGS